MKARKTIWLLVMVALTLTQPAEGQNKKPKLREHKDDTKTEALERRAEVLLETTKGYIRISLYDETPAHRDNFLRLTSEHFYDSLLFHRTIRGFMIQTGDPASRNAIPGQELGDSSVAYTLPAEIRLPAIYHRRGAVAMAREGDETNPEHRSDGCQFYIVWGKRFSTDDIEYMHDRMAADTECPVELTPEMMNTYRTAGGTPHLDGAYTVFGEITGGMDVVENIQRCDTDYNDRPVYDVRILRATVVRWPEETERHDGKNAMPVGPAELQQTEY